MFLLSCFVSNFYLMLCTLIGAVILSINIQVGLNMHPYDDIEDASSSLRGLTSSFFIMVFLLFQITQKILEGLYSSKKLIIKTSILSKNVEQLFLLRSDPCGRALRQAPELLAVSALHQVLSWGLLC